MTADPEITLEGFKTRLPLVEIVQRWVKLTRRGREWQGLCPFHKEKSPSFHVAPDKGFYHCFGCGAHGTAIDFVMQVERLEFGPAIERLSDLTGIPAPQRRREDKGERDARERLLTAIDAARAWFTDRLWGEGGAGARAYLERRSVDRETARTFQLGFAPDDRTALKAAMLRAGYTLPELLAAGLLAAPEGGADGFDRFRDRLMFPIADTRGRTVGFGGRALGEAKAKYLNSPDGELFHKGHLLYNHLRAAPAAREAGTLVVAEGYMDVIALWRAGIRHAVAPLGTAVTEQQLALLWRHTDQPIVCLDGDRAGLAAALRAADRALPLLQGGRTLRFALLPEGEDPDSLLAKAGPVAVRAALQQPLPMSELIWRLETQAVQITTPEARSGLMRRLRGMARRAADPDLRRDLEGWFAQRLEERFPRQVSRPPRHRGERFVPPPPVSVVGAARLQVGLADQQWLVQARLLAWLLHRPAWLTEDEDGVAALEFDDPPLERLRQEILVWHAEAHALDASDLTNHLSRYGLSTVAERVRKTVAAATWLRGDEDEAASRDAWRTSLSAYRSRRAQHAHDRVSEPGKRTDHDIPP